MKKFAIIVALLLLTCTILLYFVYQSGPGSDTTQPSGQNHWSRVSGLAISKNGHRDNYEKVGGTWLYRAPAPKQHCTETKVDAAQFRKISAILAHGLQSDLEEESTKLYPQLGLDEDAPELELLEANGNVLDSFKVGSSLKMEHSNEERTWILRPGAYAQRVFVPMYDVGTILRAPQRFWRAREIFSFEPNEIERVFVRVGEDSYTLVSKTSNAPDSTLQWHVEGRPDFKLDAEALGAFLQQIANLNQDNFADCVPRDTVTEGILGASVVFFAKAQEHRIEIGMEAALHKDAAILRDLKDKDRLAIIDERVVILSNERVMTLLPDLSMLKERQVLALQSGEIQSVILIFDGQEAQLRQEKGYWRYTWAGKDSTLDEEKLAQFLRQVQDLRAIRYANPQEIEAFKPQSQVLVQTQTGTYSLNLANAGQGVFLAQINDGEVFLLWEQQAQRLMAQLSKPDNKEK